MADKFVNKAVLGDGTVLIDLTGDTVEQQQVLSGYTFHDKTGATKTGTCNYDVNSAEATASVSELLAGKTAAVRGSLVTGTMPNNGAVSGKVESLTNGYIIPQGYHDGSGQVKIKDSEAAKIIPTNLKAGIEILGVTGTFSGETVNAQSKNATPSFSQQIIQPDENYDYLSAVTIAAIPVTYTDNAAGGKTCTIG